MLNIVRNSIEIIFILLKILCNKSEIAKFEIIVKSCKRSCKLCKLSLKIFLFLPAIKQAFV